MSLDPAFVLRDSITKTAPDDAGKIAISGSHGGLFAAALASRAGFRAVVLNDAGRGLDDAGIGGLAALDRVAMAGLAVDAGSARIGDARDSLASGRVSYVNETAAAIGCRVGIPLQGQLASLLKAERPQGMLDPVPEARWVQTVGRHEVLCVDSASLVTPQDAGRIIVAGSHGGLVGGDPARACEAEARLVFFNDAGGGKDGAGRSRLPALDDRGIAGAVLDCRTCRIGEARSAMETGRISELNSAAAALGLRRGQGIEEALGALA